ncbi:MAG TPA: hypothetical protein VGF01_19585 [Terracidiphilus sp.]
MLSASVRSIVYLAAMLRSSRHDALSILLIEMAYVTLTAGLYAGMQQKALGLRNRLFGNLLVVVCVPGLAQFLDWLIHRVAGAVVPGRVLLTVCIFTFISALFHLYLMRRGAFLTNHHGRSLRDDFRRMPRLVLGFVIAPVILFMALTARSGSEAKTEAAL